MRPKIAHLTLLTGGVTLSIVLTRKFLRSRRNVVSISREEEPQNQYELLTPCLFRTLEFDKKEEAERLVPPYFNDSKEM